MLLGIEASCDEGLVAIYGAHEVNRDSEGELLVSECRVTGERLLSALGMSRAGKKKRLLGSNGRAHL